MGNPRPDPTPAGVQGGGHRPKAPLESGGNHGSCVPTAWGQQSVSPCLGAPPSREELEQTIAKPAASSTGLGRLGAHHSSWAPPIHEVSTT